MTRYYDLTKQSEKYIVSQLIENYGQPSPIEKLEIQCIRAAAKQDFLSEEEMDDVNFKPNIHRGQA